MVVLQSRGQDFILVKIWWSQDLRGKPTQKDVKGTTIKRMWNLNKPGVSPNSVLYTETPSMYNCVHWCSTENLFDVCEERRKQKPWYTLMLHCGPSGRGLERGDLWYNRLIQIGFPKKEQTDHGLDVIYEKDDNEILHLHQ